MITLCELKFDYLDPRFSQFHLPEEASSYFGHSHLIKDFGWKNPGKLSWEPYRLSEVWEPQEVLGTVPAFCDYPTMDNKPAFSRRAVAALSDLLEPCGELLPLITPTGSYFVFNVLAICDAFDRDQADADFMPESSKETAFSVDRFAFHKDRLGEFLKDHAIFRIREYPTLVVVDERFKSRVEQAGLNGFHFVKLWPFPHGESWEDAERKEKRRRKREGVVSELRGQAIEIRLPTTAEPDDDHEPSEEDYERAGDLVETLREALTVKQNSPDDPFVGAIEAVEPGPQGFIITIIGPDAKQAFEVIEPTLRTLNWPHPHQAILVPGNPFDSSVVPETVEFP